MMLQLMPSGAHWMVYILRPIGSDQPGNAAMVRPHNAANPKIVPVYVNTGSVASYFEY
ncbi:hypothetical protein [Persicitalea jodogahamensis]|uniref:Uncharacterized protein n=1 Tax=Persicitalea jodogahamensis TaxID=402147 RepID=A0A8J3D355_9BACT|nr:hypothetical protein [Persicitalea jodogahamensis]GHB63769.1 hypothetical protein GCM10007390_17000 [Persicitalea jodogahamensis]